MIAAGVLASSATAGLVLEGALNPGDEPTVFAVFGDCGHVHSASGPANVASMVKSWKPDFVLVAGDINYGTTTLGSPDWESRVGTRYGDLMLGRADDKYPLQIARTQRFYPVVGNHDTTLPGQSTGGLGGGNIRGYVDYFIRNAPGFPERVPIGSGVHGNEVSYYDFYHGNMHFIMADSDRGRVDTAFAEAQNAWIRNTLETSTGQWKFVVSHHPAWSSDAVHTSQVWMQGEHLLMADAVFAGHAHVYERLDINGTPFFTSGVGGKSFYSFRAPPLPQSQFRHNTSFGALRVSKNNTGVLCEFLSIADGANGANGGVVIDSLALGSYQAVRNIGRHSLEAIAGQSIQLETSLPVPPGGGPNALDPRIEVFGPDGMLVGAADDGAPDGINAALTFSASVSGRYTIAVLPEDATSGPYQVSVNADPDFPTDPYTVWAAQHFGFGAAPTVSAADADPEGDGRTNLVEYGTGTDPWRADREEQGTLSTPRFLSDILHVDIILKEGLREDLTYEIQATGALEGESWTSIATHTAATGWTGPAPVVTSPAEGSSTILRVCETRSPFNFDRRFYRVKVRPSFPAP